MTTRRCRAVGALAVSVVLLLAPAAWASGTFTYVQVAVGRGDAAVVQGPCGEMGVIDTDQGHAGDVLSVLDRLGSRSLKWVANTHYDADHVGGIAKLATSPGVSVGTVYDRGDGEDKRQQPVFAKYFEWATGNETIRDPVEIGDSFSLCDGEDEVTFDVVSVGTDGTAAGDVPVTEENDKGICLKITYREFDAATCGDVNGTTSGDRADVESAVAKSIGPVEFAKINHHGSRFSSNETYVNTLRPLASVVSTGKNPWGHPNAEVLKNWGAVGTVFQTQDANGTPVDGDVTVTTNGDTSFTVTTSASGKQEVFPLLGKELPMSTDVISDFPLVLACVAYAIVAWLLQMSRVVAPRDWLRQRLKDVAARLVHTDEERAEQAWAEQSVDKPWWRLPTSRVQAGWRYVHKAEDEQVLHLAEHLVEEQLRTAESQLASIAGDRAKSLRERIRKSLETTGTSSQRSALLRETKIFLHNLSDTNHEDEAALLSKALWLTILALALVSALGVLFDREAYFLLGATGALISRLTRVLRRQPKASDYGASWSTLILSPAAGALAGWVGVLVASALAGDPFKVLGDAFAAPWSDATNLLGLTVAFVSGFSERWFDRLLGVTETQLGGALPAEQHTDDTQQGRGSGKGEVGTEGGAHRGGGPNPGE
jgi:beta-lactamase superfamily II metal-dependent hydrolase